ncbi:MAG: EutN/CcmL family microcompartment protein [Candidatus Sumerlaeaceae bacterium]
MLMGRVVGTVVSTQKDEGMRGFNLLVVQNVDVNMKLMNSYTVACDAVGAGPNELVIVVQGSSARLTGQTTNKPVDAAIVCIVDSVEVDGKQVYSKSEGREARPIEMLQGGRAVNA